ncbi:hypothetical protein [Streptomyces cinnamoneus]|uniref:hypothetical protein n=1 Tax=Streptomyces cinnamoneus TaxID=53446 RepID=UPI000CEEED0D|nr:hypothetical protein [Streptomyces cinnamoneus]PPT14822.1 hypothetical protein CYQ11_19850 [Streptomyces cinnamoneus]
MSPRTCDVDDEVLAEYAAYLEDDYRCWPSWQTSWSRRGEIPTHVEVFTYTEYPLNLMDKSNFRTAATLIRCAADEDCEGTENSDEQVVQIDGSSIHYGSAYSLYVQVYEGGCDVECPGTHTEECEPGCEPDVDFCFGDACEGDCKGTRTYTKAFREAVSLAEYVKHGYPFLDEDDHSELESEVFEENLQEALDEARKAYDLDTDEDREAIVEHASEDLYDLKYEGSDGEVSWIRTAEVYAEHRDQYFLGLAREILRGAIPGQIELIAA